MRQVTPDLRCGITCDLNQKYMFSLRQTIYGTSLSSVIPPEQYWKLSRQFLRPMPGRVFRRTCKESAWSPRPMLSRRGLRKCSCCSSVPQVRVRSGDANLGPYQPWAMPGAPRFAPFETVGFHGPHPLRRSGMWFTPARRPTSGRASGGTERVTQAASYPHSFVMNANEWATRPPLIKRPLSAPILVGEQTTKPLQCPSGRRSQARAGDRGRNSRGERSEGSGRPSKKAARVPGGPDRATDRWHIC
jgi:hypothetical protein